jgi:phage gp36-like protein
MAFTSLQLLTARIDSNHLNELIGNDDALNQAIAEAGNIITSYTGIEPHDDPIRNNALLTSLAGDITIWILTGRQTGIDEQVRLLREKKYNDAIALLEKIQRGEINVNATDSTVKPSFSSIKRIELDNNADSYY